MNTLNCVILIGHMGHDPKIVEGYNPCAHLSLATHTLWKDKKGEFQKITEWHSIRVYHEGFIEKIVPKLKRGDLIFIEGTLKTRKGKDSNGNTRYVSKIIVGTGGKILILKPHLDSNRDPNMDPAMNANTEEEEIPFVG